MLTNHSVIMLNPGHEQEMKTERIVGCLGKSFQSHMAKSKLQEAAAKRHGSALEDVTNIQEARQSTTSGCDVRSYVAGSNDAAAVHHVGCRSAAAQCMH